MSSMDTTERIVRTLRNASEPALSAKMIANELDVSVRTINNHVDDLVADDRVETSQIGNATAYYVPFEDLPAHKKPDHTCNRCGREVQNHHDSAKLEVDTYFFRGNGENGSTGFYVLCRFCYTDFISWAHGDEPTNEYPYVHSWDLPTSQLIEVREDPDITTTPRGREQLDEEPKMILDFIEEQWKSSENGRGVLVYDVIDHFQNHGLLRTQIDQAVNKLRREGYLFEPTPSFFQPAK